MHYKEQQLLDKLNRKNHKKGKIFYIDGKKMNRDGKVIVKGKPYKKANG